MKELLKIQNQGAELLVDSRDAAKLLGIDHLSLCVDMDNHPRELEQLGVFRFQIEKPPKGSTGGRPKKFALLNFDQIIYLLTITQTTIQTRDLRVKLIIAFRNARQKLRPVDAILLSIPEGWKKTFKDEFYIALLRLYGEKFDASKNKKSWVGGWTNKFIYQPIYENLPVELKAKRSAYCTSTGKEIDWIKLHQFIEKHAKRSLEDHMTKVTGLLQAASSRMHFVELFAAVFWGQKQLLLGNSEFLSEFT